MKTDLPLANRAFYKQITISIAIKLFCPSLLLAGNILDNTSNPTATPPVAFSLRQLSSAYVGNTIQVQRGSDNATMDIAFTPAGELDTYDRRYPGTPPIYRNQRR